MLTAFGYFRNSFLATIAGLSLGGLLGWHATGTVFGAFSTLFIVVVLATLEISLSFDNAVVNATVLKEMTPVWRRRFITWGIAIAVFGMRIVFPLIIVAIIARIDPLSALVLAATDPDRYSRLLTSAHVSVSAFGGAFLAMVGSITFWIKKKTRTGSQLSNSPSRVLAASRRSSWGSCYCSSMQFRPRFRATNGWSSLRLGSSVC